MPYKPAAFSVLRSAKGTSLAERQGRHFVRQSRAQETKKPAPTTVKIALVAELNEQLNSEADKRNMTPEELAAKCLGGILTRGGPINAYLMDYYDFYQERLHTKNRDRARRNAHKNRIGDT